MMIIRGWKRFPFEASVLMAVTLLSLWIMVGLDDFWEGFDEFSTFGSVLRVILPVLLGVAVLFWTDENKSRIRFAVNFVALSTWLFFAPIVVMTVICEFAGDCL